MILQLPDIRQKEDTDCGRAAVACVCRYFGKKVPVVHFDEYGSHPVLIVNALQNAGLSVFHGDLGSHKLLAACTRVGQVPICLVQSEGLGHYVTVRGVTSKHVYYNDPWDGPLRVTLRQWYKDWQDTDSLGTSYKNFGIVAHGIR